jgi:CBS domain-containing protein
MQLRETLPPDTACCTPDTPVRDVVRMLTIQNRDAIAVVLDLEDKLPVGIVTNRGITLLALTRGPAFQRLRAQDCMVSLAVTISESLSIEESKRILDEFQVQRAPVVDQNGRCRGLAFRSEPPRTIPTTPILSRNLNHAEI